MKETLLPYIQKSVECPECRNTSFFRSDYTNTIVCRHCRTVIQRDSGKEGAVKPSLQAASQVFSNTVTIGTHGVWNDKKFEVIGGVYCDMERFFNNRWTISFADGTLGFLTETLGFYAIQELVKPDYPSKLGEIRGMDIRLETVELFKSRKLRVFDRASSENSFIEGECWWPDSNGIANITELGDLTERRIEVVEYSKDAFEVYDVHYTSLAALQIDNPAFTKRGPVTHTCEKCRSIISIRNPLYTQYCTCPSCGALCRYRKTIGLVHKPKEIKKLEPYIPLGSRGKIHGIEYEVMGAVKKYEAGSISTNWIEYSLFNEETGFAFLSEYNGHFSYIKEFKSGSPYPYQNNELEYDGESYALFNDYSFDTISAAGEFHTNFDRFNTNAREFISPPEMLIAEKYGNKEITWYKGVHISRDEISNAFNVPAGKMPTRYGIGPLQPMRGYVNMRLLRMLFIAGFGILFAAQIFFSANARQETVFSNTFIVPDSLPGKGIVSDPFRIQPSSSNLQVTIVAEVLDSWFSADITLVNEGTGKEYSLEKGVEYYSGYSDGEFWSEGSKQQDAILSSIPGGTYHMNIFPSSGGSKKIKAFSITLQNDVPMWRNFFILLGILTLFPLLQWGRTQIFERARWNNSPHNPYAKDEE